MVAKKFDGDRPPVLHQHRGEILDCRFGAVVPENHESVGIQWMLGYLFCVVIIESVIDAQRLKRIQHREQQRENQQVFERSIA